MERDWEAWLRNAATGPSDAEKERRDRTETRIRDAIGASPEIPAKDVRVFAKGSYANNTNVRLDADVDVAVEWIGSFATMKVFDAKDLQDADLDLVDVPPGSPPQTPADWRAQVERALLAALGSAVDTSGDKAVTVGASSSTLDADVVPCYRLRRYDSRTVFHEGIRLFPRSGGHVDNWPQQNLENGRAKNTATGRRYKETVRCIKRLENDMLDRGVIGKEVHSYLLECLTYNVANARFNSASYLERTRSVLAWLWAGLRTEGDRANEYEDWHEVNELKYLFRSTQRWTRLEAYEFVNRAWDEIGIS